MGYEAGDSPADYRVKGTLRVLKTLRVPNGDGFPEDYDPDVLLDPVFQGIACHAGKRFEEEAHLLVDSDGRRRVNAKNALTAFYELLASGSLLPEEHDGLREAIARSPREVRDTFFSGEDMSEVLSPDPGERTLLDRLPR